MKEIVKIIQAKTDQNTAQIAASIGYSRGHLSRLQNEEDDGSDGAAIIMLLKEKYANVLQGVTLKESQKHFTPEQLYAMFMTVAEMQTGILKNIQSTMAQQETLRMTMEKVQAIDTRTRETEINLQRVFGGVETIGERQEKAIKQIQQDLKQIKEAKKVPS